MKTQLLNSALLLFTTIAFSQNIAFEEITGTPFDGLRQPSYAFADVDGDNDLDVLISGNDQSFNYITTLYLNDGSGNYTESTGNTFVGLFRPHVVFADIDNDNDMDLLINGVNDNSVQVIILYANDGSGNFTEVTGTPFTAVGEDSIAFADIDNDNDLDLLIQGGNNTSGAVSDLFENDGSGNFTKITGTPFDLSGGGIAFVDVDNDNDLDLIMTGNTPAFIASAKLYTNDGTGNYSEATGTPFLGTIVSSVDFADVDNDGDQDIIISGIPGANQDPISNLYLNDGNGNFTDDTSFSVEPVWDGRVKFADFDNDNDSDLIVVGSGVSSMFTAKVYSNDGNGNFTEVPGLPFEPVGNAELAIADIDNDNDQDVILGGLPSNFTLITKLYRNNVNSLTTDSFLSVLNSNVYPNPTQGTVNIELDKLQTNLNVIVRNLLGQELSSYKFDAVKNVQLNINGNSGVYLIEINNGNTREVIKILKN